MSPILTMQRRMRELGRIRMGEKGDRGQPSRLETFRLTTANREHLEAAVQAYGGEILPWQSPRGREWQLTIAAPHLDVIIPPEVAVDPWLELWTGGGCIRRCDGVTESLSGEPCMCPADPKARQALAAKGEACKPTTRLSVCLPALPDLGVWRLESHGYYAAVELSGMAEVLRAATLQGVMLPARLRIERRQVKRPNEPRKDFTVPVLEIPARLGALLPEGPLSVPRIGAPAAAPLALPPGPELPATSTLRAPRQPRRCESASPSGAQCADAAGHDGEHRNRGGERWGDAPEDGRQPSPAGSPAQGGAIEAEEAVATALCDSRSPYAERGQEAPPCIKPAGHKGNHRSGESETWA